MTNEEIRIAVAEELGWELVDDKLTGRNPSRSFDHYSIHGNEPVPNYPTSLDACAEFEDILTEEESDQYEVLLDELTNNRCWKATSLQRCEAFLRLRGRYVEDEK